MAPINKKAKEQILKFDWIYLIWILKVADWQELKEMAKRFAEPVFLASGGTDLYKIGTATEIQYRATGTRKNVEADFLI